MEKLLLISIIISFLTTLIILPFWIKKARNVGLIWKDMNKFGNTKAAGSGGLSVIIGFVLGILTYIAIRTFYFNSVEYMVEIFALTTSILLLAGIGIIDDLLGWQHGGLRKRIRIILILFAAIPLMVINAGESIIYVPFFGLANLGILYALLVIPVGIIGSTTTFNFLAGYNGLEAGQGILLLSALSIMALKTGSVWLALIGLCAVVSLFAFLIYNKFPAKVFPGDVLTYPMGGMIAIMAILGNYERFAVFIFIPYIIETGLKLRGSLIKESFGKPQPDGSIKNKYDKIYGLEHLAIRILEKTKKNKKAHEVEVVLLIHGFQVLIILLGFLIFF